MFVEKIRKFAGRFSGKLDDDLLYGVLNYVDYNEESLAIEILCDHLIEYEVDLSLEDSECLKKILVTMKIDISEAPFKYFYFS